MKSEEGKETLAQIQAEENITLEGFPDPEEYQLKALNPDDDNREEAVTVSAVVEENGNIEVKGGEEQEGSLIKISEFSREEDSEINRKEGSANEEEGAVEVESSVVEGPLGEIIHSLKSELQDLEEIGLLGKVHTEEEKTIIKDCTLKINEELIKVNGFVENEKEISLESIQELESKVKSQIQIIKDHSSEDGFGLIQPYIEEIDSCFSKISGESQSEKISSRKAKSYVKKIKSLLNNIESGSDFDHQAVVSRSFNRMMKKIEDQLGSKIKLSTDVGLYGELPEYLKHELNLDDVMSSSSQDIKYFQHKILKQSLIIQDLTKKYNSSRNTLKELKDKWFVFHIQAKKNLDPSDRLAAKTIETEFENFDNQFGSTEENSKTLASITNDLVQEMGGKELKIDPQLLAEIGALSEENQEKLKEFIKNNESVSSPQGKEDIEEDI
ncbi:MAG: hypothetical protein KDD50_13520, partial [Bdellovibrionales bacterium]|nr:hypothetical protein [Bdellovibrionales bacterium]